MNKDELFQETYTLWLKKKNIRHSPDNLSRFCQIWNEKLNIATKNAIIKFNEEVKK